MSTTPKMVHGIDAQLTVGNGTNTVTLVTVTIPSPTGAVDGINLMINGAHGVNSFKANAAALSYLEAWIDIQPADDANWRRLTPSAAAYRLLKADTHDILAIDNISGNIAGATMFRVQCALSLAPAADIDIDYMFLFETDQKH
jgi:hypothetical protein